MVSPVVRSTVTDETTGMNATDSHDCVAGVPADVPSCTGLRKLAHPVENMRIKTITAVQDFFIETSCQVEDIHSNDHPDSGEFKLQCTRS